jgi:hypothetical protein
LAAYTGWPCWAARPSGLAAAQLAGHFNFFFFIHFLYFPIKKIKGKTPQMNSTLLSNSDVMDGNWMRNTNDHGTHMLSIAVGSFAKGGVLWACVVAYKVGC